MGGRGEREGKQWGQLVKQVRRCDSTAPEDACATPEHAVMRVLVIRMRRSLNCTQCKTVNISLVLCSVDTDRV